MVGLSNKSEPIKQIFAHLNHMKLDRIDAFELISAIILSIDGTFESFLKNVIFVFGFSDSQSQESISKDEFHFYLDCLFRGVMNLAVPPQHIQNLVQ